MSVRAARMTDVDCIVVLWKEMADLHSRLDKKFSIRSNSETLFREYALKTINHLDKQTFVYVDDKGEVRGYLFAEIDFNPPVYMEERKGVISEISVSESFRNRGAGRELLTSAEAWFRSEGVKRAECHVAVNNKISQGFWKKRGYRPYMNVCSANIEEK